MLNTIPLRTKLRTSSSIKNNYLRVLDLFEKANQDHSLFLEGDRIVVGLSGGADSVSLLMILKRISRSRHLNIYAAHMDHGYHRQSATQAKFCRDLCHALSVPFYLKRISLLSLAKKNGGSLEEVARFERYRFFGEVCKKTGAKLVATAHTLDDQAETVLMRLLRGTGFRGLVAIPWKRRENNFTLIRPLLYCEKESLVSWLRSEKISFCDDPTNVDEAFTRNFVRRRLIPLLEKRLNPQTKRALADFQSAFQDGFEFIEAHAHALYKKCVSRKGKSVFVDRRAAKKAHPVVADEMLRLALSDVTGDFLGIGFHHIRQMRNLFLAKDRIGKTLCLPGNLKITQEKDGLRIAKS
jgi:tRNA(Ile)-lysidine synthase